MASVAVTFPQWQLGLSASLKPRLVDVSGSMFFGKRCAGGLPRLHTGREGGRDTGSHVQSGEKGMRSSIVEYNLLYSRRKVPHMCEPKGSSRQAIPAWQFCWTQQSHHSRSAPSIERAQLQRLERKILISAYYEFPFVCDHTSHHS